jgi:transposase InsO family protein
MACLVLFKIAGGMVYMAAIIDWHSKAVLSHRISNTMDSQLVMSVLNDALEKHPHIDKPKVFSLFASHSFSTVTLPTSVVKRSFCF